MSKVISPVKTEERQNLGIKAGDTVRVWQKIEEKGKTRLQAFEGIVLARKHGSEAGATFTVRKVSEGVGVEKIFPLYSPVIDKIEIIKRAKVRRSKLYYIRDKAAREIRRQMRNMKTVNISTEEDAEEKTETEKTSEETKPDESKSPDSENKAEEKEVGKDQQEEKGPSADSEPKNEEQKEEAPEADKKE